MENEKLKELYTNRIKEGPDGYERALKTFEKHLDRIPKTNDVILQKAAYTFTQSALAPLSIQKRKKGSIIPVQVFHLFTVFLVFHESFSQNTENLTNDHAGHKQSKEGVQNTRQSSSPKWPAKTRWKSDEATSHH